MTTVVHCRKQPYDVLIDRTTRWGNPFKVGRDGTRVEVIEKHLLWLMGLIVAPDGSQPPSLDDILHELKNQRLGCWCTPKACHGDNYVAICDDNTLFS